MPGTNDKFLDIKNKDILHNFGINSKEKLTFKNKIVGDTIQLWEPDVEYEIDDIVTYENIIYRCCQPNTNTVFDDYDWIPLTGVTGINEIFDHMNATVGTGIHDFPIADEEDGGKLIVVDNLGNYILLFPNQLGLVETVGPNPPFIFYPSNYGSIPQPTLIDFMCTNTLSAGVNSVRATVYVYDHNTESAGRNIWTTNWISNRTNIRIPYGLLTYNMWYVLRMECRDNAGRLSDSTYVLMKCINAHDSGAQYWTLSPESWREDLIESTKDMYVLLQYPRFLDTNHIVGKPNAPVVTNFLPFQYLAGNDSISKNTDHPISLLPYAHLDSIGLKYVITRLLKKSTNTYHNTQWVIGSNVTSVYGMWRDFECDTLYELEVFVVDNNCNQIGLANKIIIQTINPVDLFTIYRQGPKSGNMIMQSSSHVFALTKDLQENSSVLDTNQIKGKSNSPNVLNFSTQNINYMTSIEPLNIKYNRMIELAPYVHTESISLKYIMTRLRKMDNTYCNTQWFYGTNITSIKTQWLDFKPNTKYELEVFAVDNNHSFKGLSDVIAIETLDPVHFMTPTKASQKLGSIDISSLTNTISLKKDLNQEIV